MQAIVVRESLAEKTTRISSLDIYLFIDSFTIHPDNSSSRFALPVADRKYPVSRRMLTSIPSRTSARDIASWSYRNELISSSEICTKAFIHTPEYNANTA